MADASIWQPGSEIPLVNAESTFIPQIYTATAAQRLFPLTAFSYVLNTHSLFVWVNGVMQTVGAPSSGLDVEETSTSSFSLTFDPDAGDKVVAVGVVGSTNTAVSVLKAAEAAASAAAALVSQTAAAASATAAANSATASATSAGDSLTSALLSAASATNAALSESVVVTSISAALAAADVVTTVSAEYFSADSLTVDGTAIYTAIQNVVLGVPTTPPELGVLLNSNRPGTSFKYGDIDQSGGLLTMDDANAAALYADDYIASLGSVASYMEDILTPALAATPSLYGSLLLSKAVRYSVIAELWKVQAEDAATLATTKANIAITNADIAVTEADNAANSAIFAYTQAEAAEAAANLAGTSATNAATSATAAASSATIAAANMGAITSEIQDYLDTNVLTVTGYDIGTAILQLIVGQPTTPPELGTLLNTMVPGQSYRYGDFTHSGGALDTNDAIVALNKLYVPGLTTPEIESHAEDILVPALVADFALYKDILTPKAVIFTEIAGGYKDEASGYATNAAASATTAATSATAAAQSKEAAATSETNAADYRNEAAQFLVNANFAASQAEAAATAASTSAAAASTSEINADTYATAAGTFSVSAASAAATAASSATAAAASATNAATSATAAQGYAGILSNYAACVTDYGVITDSATSPVDYGTLT